MSSMDILSQGMAGNLDACGMSGAEGISNMYEHLVWQAMVGRFWGRVIGQRCGLRALGQVLEGHTVCGQRSLGLRTVSVDHIVGSEGRCQDFDRRFRPLQTHTRQRWCSVAQARELGAPLPPVTLIRVGDSYYVRDGHHRISVARALGESDIEAAVTEYTLAPRTVQGLALVPSGATA